MRLHHGLQRRIAIERLAPGKPEDCTDPHEVHADGGTAGINISGLRVHLAKEASRLGGELYAIGAYSVQGIDTRLSKAQGPGGVLRNGGELRAWRLDSKARQKGRLSGDRPHE